MITFIKQIDIETVQKENLGIEYYMFVLNDHWLLVKGKGIVS